MKRYLALATFAVATVISLSSPPAEAVPAFARQMGVSCNTCHFQHFPMLNNFGRAFKASGFTMNTSPLIESEHFSLPANMNVALFSNIRYQKSNGKEVPGPHIDTSDEGEWVVPGETSLFVAGRASENMGVLIEGDVGGAGASSGAGYLASLKAPIIFPASDTFTVGVVPFTSGLGPAYAFEVLNTGAVGNHVMTLVHPTEVSAQQYVQVGAGTTYGDYEGDAEGIGLFAASSTYYFTAAKWQPNHNSLNSDLGATAQSTSNYFRAVMTPHVGGWDLGFGVQYFGGQSAIVGDDGLGNPILDHVYTKAAAIDAQAQGSLAQKPFGVYFSYAAAPGTKAGELPNLYNPNPDRKKAMSVAAEWALFARGRGTLELAYRKADTGATTDSSDDAVTVGLTYMIAHNIQFALLNTSYSGDAHSSSNPSPLPISASGSGDNLTSVNLAVGF
jgi:hypothetical protein